MDNLVLDIVASLLLHATGDATRLQLRRLRRMASQGQSHPRGRPGSTSGRAATEESSPAPPQPVAPSASMQLSVHTLLRVNKDKFLLLIALALGHSRHLLVATPDEAAFRALARPLPPLDPATTLLLPGASGSETEGPAGGKATSSRPKLKSIGIRPTLPLTATAHVHSCASVVALSLPAPPTLRAAPLADVPLLAKVVHQFAMLKGLVLLRNDGLQTWPPDTLPAPPPATHPADAHSQDSVWGTASLYSSCLSGATPLGPGPWHPDTDHEVPGLSDEVLDLSSSSPKGSSQGSSSAEVLGDADSDWSSGAGVEVLAGSTPSPRDESPRSGSQSSSSSVQVVPPDPPGSPSSAAGPDEPPLDGDDRPGPLGCMLPPDMLAAMPVGRPRAWRQLDWRWLAGQAPVQPHWRSPLAFVADQSPGPSEHFAIAVALSYTSGITRATGMALLPPRGLPRACALLLAAPPGTSILCGHVWGHGGRLQNVWVQAVRFEHKEGTSRVDFEVPVGGKLWWLHEQCRHIAHEMVTSDVGQALSPLLDDVLSLSNDEAALGCVEGADWQWVDIDSHSQERMPQQEHWEATAQEEAALQVEDVPVPGEGFTSDSESDDRAKRACAVM